MKQHLINGQELANNIKTTIVEIISQLNYSRPNLAIILVGQRPDSSLYVHLKQEEAKKTGIDTHLYRCPETIDQNELLAIIDFLNNDPLIDGLLLQLPLPSHLNTNLIVNRIASHKDVDGFTANNLKKLANNDPLAIIPPVFGVVLQIIAKQEYNINEKTVAILGNSDIFTKNLAKILNQLGAKSLIFNQFNQTTKLQIEQAQVIISALGQPHQIKLNDLPDNYLIIDIGITKKNSKVYGDVDLTSINPQRRGWATPVPGGVGPLTIAMALNNTLLLHQRNHDSTRSNK